MKVGAWCLCLGLVGAACSPTVAPPIPPLERIEIIEKSDTAAGRLLTALHQARPDVHEEIVASAIAMIENEGVTAQRAIKGVGYVYTPLLMKNLARLSDAQAAEFIDVRIALSRHLLPKPLICVNVGGPGFDDSEIPEELQDRLLMLVANYVSHPDEGGPVLDMLELGAWASELDTKWAGKLAELEASSLRDPSEQAALVKCWKTLFMYEGMGKEPAEKRGAVFRTSMG